MEKFPFTAHYLDAEIDLNSIAKTLHAGRKLTWEEPLILVNSTLLPYQGEPFSTARAYIYYFGAIVFFNCNEADINSFYDSIGRLADSIRPQRGGGYTEKYHLVVDKPSLLEVNNNYAVVPTKQAAYVDIIAYTLAKSVALEKIEALLEIVFDTMEEIISMLDKGKLALPDSQLAKTASSILNFKYRSLSHIMILDKPEITWEIEEADRLYLTLANIFELQQRYSQIRHKSDTLLDINSVFATLSHARRAARLEWIIIILIAFETALFLLDMLRH